MKHFILSLSALLLSLFAFSQNFNIKQPVVWKADYQKIDKSTYEVIVTGTIENDAWHIYDMESYEDGPNPTTLTIEGDDIELVGKPYIKSKVKKLYDQMFGMEIGICEKEIILVQKVKVNSKKAAKIFAIVEWQACDDKTCLTPTEKEFSLTLSNK